jgi:anaerobic magnesium-protoporphyrin IX monomethyl ester cyclase
MSHEEQANTVDLRHNLGTRSVPKLRMANFPNADKFVHQGLLEEERGADAVDIMLVNPPTQDGQLWIRTQHRVSRRTRGNIVCPQASLGQMGGCCRLADKSGKYVFRRV